ncbi:signal recognition particle subunit SRP72 [Oryza brachyantha]|uniref:Signal recognition particle subunit SRP72 n=1 Tax=Oryza brachyantha TaxID=4533 RepID=J3L6L4_ORYBR|nr:signal recognition particle subunit SRP72 [Oryza brachyantha]
MPPKSKAAAAAAAASAAQPVAVEDLFAALHRHIEAGEFPQAVKVADQVLAVAPGDEDAVRCKVVAHIKSDATEKALAAIRAAERLPIDLSYYKAYCFYRQNKLQEALELLRGQEETSAVLQLESQIYYRLGRMNDCMNSYEKLQKFKVESMDLKINIIAALVAAGRASEVQATMKAQKVDLTTRALRDARSFELAYNSACSLIENKKYSEAKEQLDLAKRIGKEELMGEDYGDDEIEYELAPVSAQLAYVQQLQGQTQEAMETYTKMTSQNLADPSSLAVATTNLISLKGTKDAADSLRKLGRLIEKSTAPNKLQLIESLEFKLSPRQKEALYSAHVLLLLHANRIDQAHELVSGLLGMFQDSTFPVLLQAAVHVREKKIQKAEEILSRYAEKHPENSKGVLLALAQIAASANHLQIAADSLSKITDIQHMPATVATLVALKERLGDSNGASSVLDSAIQWWKNSMTEDSKLDVFMREAATFKLNHGHDEAACQLYEELVKSFGSAEALAGLVATSARTNLEKAEQYEKKLKPLPGLKGIDVESLEKTSGARPFEVPKPMNEDVTDEVKKQKAKKRKRKPRYPKGFDPANPGPPPDPERWLPKRERSSYRPKRKDKRAQVRGAQGAVTRDKHDTSATSSANASSSSKANQATKAATAASDQPKGSNKSRKKKSRS